MTRALLLIAGWMGQAFALWLSRLRHPQHVELVIQNARLVQEAERYAILRRRLEALDSHRRPHFQPEERLAILCHMRRYGISMAQAAEAFVVSVQTLVNWLEEVEGGSERLVRPKAPANKLPDLVAEVVLQIKACDMAVGTRRIAGILAKLGLKASRTSVQRIFRRRRPRPPAKEARSVAGTIRARRPGHVWILDFTRVGGFFRSVVVGAVIDAFSRKIVAIRVTPHEPKAVFAVALLGEAIRREGAPVHVITDKGVQFTSSAFTHFLARRKIRHRYGAIGRKGSIALIERFWRSMKEEFADRWLAFRSIPVIEKKLRFYLEWYHLERPHAGLGLRTPDEMHRGVTPREPGRVEDGRLEIHFLDGDRRLPVFRLRRAA